MVIPSPFLGLSHDARHVISVFQLSLNCSIDLKLGSDQLETEAYLGDKLLLESVSYFGHCTHILYYFP